MDERPAEENPTAWPGPIAFGIAVAVLVRFGVGAIPVTSGAPIVLRWARILADHPVRTALAAALLVVVVRPRAAPTEGSTPITDSRPRSSH